jgi:FeS assembly SUF system protein
MSEQNDSAAPAPPVDGKDELRQSVIEILSTITDPEIPVNIYELGLIYEVEISDEGDTRVVMTLTTPKCPVAESMPGEVENRVGSVPGVCSVSVELVWDPPWTPDRMSEAAKLELGFI